jgi:integrase/recombinase XerC
MRVTESGGSGGFNGSIPGAARLLLVDGVALLRPEERVFTAMLTGFANQQLARNLARTTVEGRENAVKAFTAYVNTYPWNWTPAMVDEWLGDLRSLRDLKRTTIRSYSEAVRSFPLRDRPPLRMDRDLRGTLRHSPGPSGA